MLNINENMLMDYMMSNTNLFDSIAQLLIRSSASHGYDICLLLALLLQYHKYDVSLLSRPHGDRGHVCYSISDIQYVHCTVLYLR